MADECLICGAPLEYLDEDVLMECAICRRTAPSKARCTNGHYVCDHCHMKGLDAILGICMGEKGTDPVAIAERMMSSPFCHMHGPEHHVIVGSALLTAYRNAGGKVDLSEALPEMIRRGSAVPGGACGFWGACGAGISTGMFVSIATGSTPLSEGSWGLSNRMTSKALASIGGIGGPRCCKRDTYLAILSAIDFAKEELGVEMARPEIACTRSRINSQCIHGRCPFWKPRAVHLLYQTRAITRP